MGKKRRKTQKSPEVWASELYYILAGWQPAVRQLQLIILDFDLHCLVDVEGFFVGVGGF